LKLRLLFLFLGLALFAAVIAWFGAGEVLSAFSHAGWGLIPVIFLHVLPFAIDTAAWISVYGASERPSAWMLFLIRWTGESVNNLLPVAQVGGDVLRARLAARPPGSELPAAGATVAVDVTAGLISQILMGVGGLAFLIARDRSVVELAFGLALFAAGIVGFWYAQRRGMFGMAARLIGGLESADRLDLEIRSLYRRPRALVLSTVIRVIGRVAAGVETYAGLWLLGADVTLLDAVILQSLVSLVRSAAFVIPGGLGAQEGGMVLVGDMLGIAPQLALALALIRRVREVVLGVPGLLVWPLLEKRR
jgi:putative membrane protein